MTFYVDYEAALFPAGVKVFSVDEVVERVMETVLEDVDCPYEVQINLLLTDDVGIRHYNKEFRSMDKPTDVLSFPAIPFVKAGDFSIVEECSVYFEPESGELLLGDIAISVDRVRIQAAEYGHSLKREFAFLFAHSMFHLCGYDHMTGEEAKYMEEKQEAVLAKLGINRGTR